MQIRGAGECAGSGWRRARGAMEGSRRDLGAEMNHKNWIWEQGVEKIEESSTKEAGEEYGKLKTMNVSDEEGAGRKLEGEGPKTGAVAYLEKRSLLGEVRVMTLAHT